MTRFNTKPLSGSQTDLMNHQAFRSLLLPAALFDGETLTATITEDMKRVYPRFDSHSIMS